MAYYNQSTRERVADINQGLLVKKTGAACDAIATVNIFTITGGNVCLLGLVGVWEGNVGVNATTIALNANPTTGTATAIAAASGTQSGKTTGAMLTLANDLGALVGSTNHGAALMGAVPRLFVRGPGVIEMVVAGAAADNNLTWYLTYVPLDVGAYVEAA